MLSDTANISTSVQRCFQVDTKSRRRTTSNQRWNNVVYVNVEIYNVQQRCHFQRRFSQSWATSKHSCEYGHLKKKKKNKPRFKNKIIFLSFKEYYGLTIFFIFPHIQRTLQKHIVRASKIFKTLNILNNKKYI